MLWTELPPAARPEVAQRPWMSKEEAAAAIRQARRWSGGKEYVPLGQGGNRLSFKGTGGFDTNEAQLRVSFANRVAGPFLLEAPHRVRLTRRQARPGRRRAIVHREIQSHAYSTDDQG